MKRKIASIILAACMAMPCIVSLAACGGGDEDTSHAHEWQITYTYDSTGHWQKCEHCSKTTEKQSHEFNQGTCTVCGYVDKALLPPQKGLMSKYFSGVKATYTKESVKDSDGTVKEFKNLVDRQIDVLAQDILARLDYVYGQHRTQTGSYVWGYAFPLYDLTGNEVDKIYRYYSDSTQNGLPALADSSNMLSQLSKEYLDTINEGTATLVEVDIDDLSDYQKSLLIKDTDNNILASTEFFNLIGASSGQNMKIVSKVAGKRLDSDEAKKWLVTDLTSDEAKTALKLMIAQELIGDEGDDYDALIGLIDTLGYKPDFSENLIKIINNKIIGAERITEDNGYYDIIKNKYEGKITPDNTNAIDVSLDYSETNSPRLYKGYKVIIPALVNSALENKFYDTQVSLYPKFSNTAVDYTSNATGFNEAHAYETLTLLAKEGTPYTKLVVKIKGLDISSDVSLSCEAKLNNSVVYHKRISLTNEEQIFEVDLSEFGSRSFGEYQGNKIADINDNIFVNSKVVDYDDINYIKLTFTNKSGAKFTVSFDGYYDK